MAPFPSRKHLIYLAGILSCSVLTAIFNGLQSFEYDEEDEFEDPPILKELSALSLGLLTSDEYDALQGLGLRRRLLTTSNYTLEDVFNVVPTFNTQVYVFVYYAEIDEFIVLYDDRLDFGYNCKPIYEMVPQISFLFRYYFPEKFQGPGSSDWVVLLSVGNFDKISKAECHEPPFCGSDTFPPILHFGNVMKDTANMYPSVIPMPKQGSGLLECFAELAETGQICNNLLTENWVQLLHGKGFSTEFKNLVPQVFWRGTDIVPEYGDTVKPNYKKDAEATFSNITSPSALKRAAIDVLNQVENLRPRWKGAVMTAEAQRYTRKKNKPWANMKIETYIDKSQKIPSVNGQEYQYWNKLGIPAATRSVRVNERAKYKYQLTIGGDPWIETFEKLSMPGLLFKVESDSSTPIADYVDQHFEPWVHYVPILPDLSDLKEKFDWAQTHTLEAETIAKRATFDVSRMSLPQALGARSSNFFRSKVAPILDLYQAVPGAIQALLTDSGTTIYPLMKCTGRKTVGDCIYLADERKLPDDEKFFSLRENIIGA